MTTRTNQQHINSVEELRDMLSSEWLSCIGQEFSKPYWNNIITTLNRCNYLPEKNDIFNALNMCPPSKVKVVIIGQDPYIHSNEAHGFSFSVKPGVTLPPSLHNVYKELQLEYGKDNVPTTGCLIPWTREGVLLLNSVLTVQQGKSNSHAGIGWEEFTSFVIRYIDTRYNPSDTTSTTDATTFSPNGVVFMAWGKNAVKICTDNVKYNTILSAGHPSPRNTTNPFVGCNCFREANEILIRYGRLPVRWLNIYN